jgi:hypothetical protein
MPIAGSNHLPVARKTSCEESRFGWLEVVATSPLFVLAGYSVPGRSGRTTLSCARLNLFAGASDNYLDGPREL